MYQHYSRLSVSRRLWSPQCGPRFSQDAGSRKCATRGMEACLKQVHAIAGHHPEAVLQVSVFRVLGVCLHRARLQIHGVLRRLLLGCPLLQGSQQEAIAFRRRHDDHAHEICQCSMLLLPQDARKAAKTLL